MTHLFDETPRSHMNLSELLKEKEEKESLIHGILDDNGDLISGLRISPSGTVSIIGSNIKLNPVGTGTGTDTSDWFNFASADEREALVYDDILDHLHELTVESMEDLVTDIEDIIKEASVPFETPEDNLEKGEDIYKQGELQDDGSVSYENEPTITIHLDTTDFEEKIDKLIKSLKEIKADETFDNLFGKALSSSPVPEPLRLHEQLDKKRLDKIEADITTIKNDINNVIRDVASNSSDIELLKEYVL